MAVVDSPEIVTSVFQTFTALSVAFASWQLRQIKTEIRNVKEDNERQNQRNNSVT